MNSGPKAILYAILLIATAVTGYFFFHSFGKLFEEEKPAPSAQTATAGAPEAEPAPDTNAVPDTNVVAAVSTNSVSTNTAAGTNVVAEATTNTPVATNVVAETKEKKSKVNKTATAPAAGTAKAPRSRIGAWTGGFILSIILLGGLIAWDVSNFMGNKSLKVLYNDDGPSLKDPEYEQAEQVWADGKPLEAVRMMREYLNKNPREIHVALRIAEIYEKDLSNLLAAALEYEEVLKKKLPDERWGWAAIHLCNLYFKLGQEAKSYALLQRVVKEYGGTQAADKARKRLTEVDPGLLEQVEAAPEPEEKPAPAAPEEPKSNLPPGFRPKK